MTDDEKLNHEWIMTGLGRISGHPEATWAQMYIDKLEAELAASRRQIDNMCRERDESRVREAELVGALDDLATRAERARDILSVRGEWAMLDTSLARDTLRSVCVRKEGE